LTILPGPNGSDFANQDFSSTVAIGRIRHNFGLSYISLLGTFRESEEARTIVSSVLIFSGGSMTKTRDRSGSLQQHEDP